jgi:hypothetical protein
MAVIRALENVAFTVTEAGRGDEALDLIDEVVQYLFTDIHMPDKFSGVDSPIKSLRAFAGGSSRCPRLPNLCRSLTISIPSSTTSRNSQAQKKLDQELRVGSLVRLRASVCDGPCKSCGRLPGDLGCCLPAKTCPQQHLACELGTLCKRRAVC